MATSRRFPPRCRRVTGSGAATVPAVDEQVQALAGRAAALLVARGESIAVCESSCGGMISAALLSVPGASAYYRGGAVVYTIVGSAALIGGVITPPAGMRGATEAFAGYQAEAIRRKLDTTWGTGETGATGAVRVRVGVGWRCWCGPRGT